MNPLDHNPDLRAKAYLVQWLVNGIMGVIGIVLVTLGHSPTWYVIAAGVLNFVWTYTGLTAQTHTGPREVAPPEGGAFPGYDVADAEHDGHPDDGDPLHDEQLERE